MTGWLGSDLQILPPEMDGQEEAGYLGVMTPKRGGEG